MPCLTTSTLDGWDSAPFLALYTPEQNPALGVLSCPAHPLVTQLLQNFSKITIVIKVTG